MKESDLYPAVRRWLIGHGWEVHVEIFGADVVAVKDGLLCAVELKLSLSDQLLRQLNWRSYWADYVIGAVPVLPKRPMGRMRYSGFGLLEVRGDVARQRIIARRQPWQWHRRHAYRIKRLTGRPPAMDHELAGLPSCPALREQRLKREAFNESRPTCG